MVAGWKLNQRARPIIIDLGLYLCKKSDLAVTSQRRSLPTAFKLFTVLSMDTISHSPQNKTQINAVEEAADLFESSLTIENTHYDEGYADGYKDGIVSGKQDGYEVGLKNGFELGEEIGFYQGLVDIWLSAVRVDPSCFSTRVQKSIHQMRELLENYPIEDPESKDVDEMKTSLRLKFRVVCASLGVKLEYDGYPKSSDAVDFGF